MDISKHIVFTPWDSRALGTDTFEIVNWSEEVLQEINNNRKPGHYTIRTQPLSSKKKLHDNGFYYCDTLFEPYCNTDTFIFHQKEGVHVSKIVDFHDLVIICNGAFKGRFHRDFNIDSKLADARYNLWLKDLYETQNILGLMYYDELAGFWGVSNNKLVLHALAEKYRRKGMAKYFWSVACQELFNAGYNELASSISISNVPILNLYSSLGFRFRNPVDIYHLFIK